MNILVTGANGQLGKEIKKTVDNYIGNGHADHDSSEKNYYIFADRDELDITDAEAVNKYIREHFINVIINCAAYTDVNKAQTDRDTAYNVNAIGPMNLALAAKEVGAVLIHISTDYVFGGKYNRPLRPITREDPDFVPADREKNFYGYSKLIGEELIMESGFKNYLIFRTSWLYSTEGNNFVKKMFEKAWNNKVSLVVADQVGSPTNAFNLAQFLVHIIEENSVYNRFLNQYGVYNFADNGVASWYDVAKTVYGVIGKDAMVKYCDSGYYESPVQRPYYSVLDLQKTENNFLFGTKYWRDEVERVVRELVNSMPDDEKEKKEEQ